MEMNRIIHGGDYNPEQWLDQPEILKKDIELMKKAHINTVTLGVFSWSMLEPEEGKFTFEWLDEIVENLTNEGFSIIMATPSGARPKWLSDKYPEVLRVDESRHRNLFGMRQNHCYTSPVYREKVAIINKKLVEHYEKYENVILWHISNELGGECHCELCQEAFRDWLKKKYKTIDKLNQQWNTFFWSHRYNDFDMIESPSPRGELFVHGLNLDWKRFVTYQMTDYVNAEVDALREAGSTKPTTLNLMYDFVGLNYRELIKAVDVVSWDAYPFWHSKKDSIISMKTALQHDLMRSLLMKPFLLMESSTTSTNWFDVSKLRNPGILNAQSMQALAHGSDSVLYFQIRQSPGASEKFHGAVIDHYGEEDTRIFKEVSQLGEDLTKLYDILGTNTKAEAAVVYDTENRWAMYDAQGPRNCGIRYTNAVQKNYFALRKMGLNVDVIDEMQPLDKYKLVAVPMGYMYREGFAEKLKLFVENGGTLVTSYWSGVVNENDRCFQGPRPYNMTDVLGLRATEIDGLYDNQSNSLKKVKNSQIMKDEYTCHNLCELVRLSTAEPLFTYGSDFYEGQPAAAVNKYGKGKAYYIGADAEDVFYDDLYEIIVKEAGLEQIMENVPDNVEVASRYSDDAEYVFIINFQNQRQGISELEGEILIGHSRCQLEPYETLVIKR